MQQIADRCRVSRQTVSRSFVDDPRIGAATRARVLAVAAEMGYDPLVHQGARRMALIKAGQDVVTQMIGLFFTPFKLRSRYVDDIFWGCWDGLANAGFSLSLFASCDPNSLQNPASLPVYLTRGDIDGLITLANPYAFENTFAQIRESIRLAARPIVFVIEEYEGCSAVLVDDRGGARAALRHLLESGHRQILHFYTDDFAETHPHAQRRLHGYTLACRDYRLDPGEHLLPVRWTEWLEETYARQLVTLLKKHPEITAILARNDKHALEVIEALTAEGWSVPGDYSVVGFDDTEQYTGPGGSNLLTTVRSPLVEVGRQAARLIIDEVLGRSIAGSTTITLPTELVIRQTTGVPRIHNT